MEEQEISTLEAAMTSIKEELAKDLANAVLRSPNLRERIIKSESSNHTL